MSCALRNRRPPSAQHSQQNRSVPPCAGSTVSAMSARHRATARLLDSRPNRRCSSKSLAHKVVSKTYLARLYFSSCTLRENRRCAFDRQVGVGEVISTDVKRAVLPADLAPHSAQLGQRGRRGLSPDGLEVPARSLVAGRVQEDGTVSRNGCAVQIGNRADQGCVA